MHKEMLPGIAPRVHVYVPPGSDLQAHLNRVAGFNARVVNPARWLPAWENANMLAKYWLTTQGVRAAHYFTDPC